MANSALKGTLAVAVLALVLALMPENASSTTLGE